MDNEQKQLLEQQKQNCPFCKIIRGEIQSKKVFENDLVIAILDIHPASEGHVLIMPKEHYPIMPLIPKETFEDLFSVAKKIADVEKMIFLKHGTSIFIANGGAAGQQSSHFMLHIIPRDFGKVSQLSIPENPLEQGKLPELYKTLSHNLPIMLKQFYSKYPILDENGNPVPLKQQYSKEQVIQIIEQNPQLKEALMKEPNEFKKVIPKNPQLKTIFGDVDADEVIAHFLPDRKPGEEKEVKAEFKEEEKEPPGPPKPEKKEDKKDKETNLDAISRMFT